MFVTNGAELQRLSIHTFGGFAVYQGTADHSLRFVSRSVEALLVYLACQERAVRRDLLAELLWPDRTQAQASTNLRTTLHRLRHQLEPYLLVTRQSVGLNPQARIDLDAAQFESNLARGQIDEATALYRGDFLDGFYLEGSPAFEQWALVERERLRTSALVAWQQRIGQAAGAGQLEVAINAAQRLLQLDPLHEPTHRQLMRLLAQAGQRSAALAQYESCRQRLQSELDVPPDEMTVALVEQIRQGKVEAPASTQAAGLSPAPAPTSNPKLPPQPTPFVGRAAELVQVEKLLSNLDCRLLTLLGVGGIGKTRLALESASRQAHNFADGVRFVNLAPVATAELAVIAIAQSLELSLAAGDLVAEIAAYLQPCHLLLILDNFEHLPEAAGVVATLLQRAPRLKLLVTSREPLYLREEWLLPVAGLSWVAGLADEAGHLFVRSAQRVQPDFTGAGQEEAIAEICRQVEGMPLALELAASWVRLMSCAAIAQEIGVNFDFLTSRARNVPDRHRSIRVLFDGSWNLLTSLEQSVLRRVSIFRGGWTLDEAAEVAGATRAALQGLVDKSLVSTDGQHRFGMHELVRQYAAEQLVASGEESVMAERHFATYLQLFRLGDGHLRGPEMSIWLARLLLEHDNLRAALQWALVEARYLDMAWLLLAASHFWYYIGDLNESAIWLAGLMPHRQTLPVALRLAILTFFFFSTGHTRICRALDAYRAEMINLIEICPEKRIQAVAWLRIAWSTPDIVEGGNAYVRSVQLAHAAFDDPPIAAEFVYFADDDYNLATVQWFYADFLVGQGKAEEVTRLMADSLQRFRKQGNSSFVADCQGILGFLALLRGDFAEASRLLQETVTISRNHNFISLQAEWQPLLALVFLYSGNMIEARRLVEESLRFALKLRNTICMARAALCQAEVAIWELDVEQAQNCLKQSLDYQPPRPRITFAEFQRLFVAARLATLQKRFQDAAMLLGATDAMHSQMHYGYNGLILPLFNAAAATVLEALGAEAFDEAYASGQQLPLEELFANLLATG